MHFRISNQEKELNNALLLKQKQQQLNEQANNLETQTNKPDLVTCESPKSNNKIELEKTNHLNITANKTISSPSTTISDNLNLLFSNKRKIKCILNIL